MSNLLLNVGSGQRPFPPPWINIDCQSKWEPDYVADAGHMPFFEDSASMIVLHHVLEHFGCGEGLQAIRECRRILAPGGSLIVTVPDVAALVKGWIRGQITNQIFFTNIYGAYSGDEADRHKWGFTPGTLFKEINEAERWSKIMLFDFRRIDGADIAKDWWITGVEAIK